MIPTPAAPLAPAPAAATPDDDEIVRRVVAGETALFELLMRRHNQRIYRTARAILGDDAEAEDVMQDAYVRAFANLGAFEHRALFSTWLTKIAVHEALARLRARRRYDLVDATLDDLTDDANMAASSARTPEQQAADLELGVAVERAVDALPANFRAVFVLRAVEELSTADVAACLEIPEDTVKTRLHRARGLLQKALFAKGEEAARRTYAFHLTRCDRVVAGVLARIAAGERPG